MPKRRPSAAKKKNYNNSWTCPNLPLLKKHKQTNSHPHTRSVTTLPFLLPFTATASITFPLLLQECAAWLLPTQVCCACSCPTPRTREDLLCTLLQAFDVPGPLICGWEAGEGAGFLCSRGGTEAPPRLPVTGKSRPTRNIHLAFHGTMGCDRSLLSALWQFPITLRKRLILLWTRSLWAPAFLSSQLHRPSCHLSLLSEPPGSPLTHKTYSCYSRLSIFALSVCSAWNILLHCTMQNLLASGGSWVPEMWLSQIEMGHKCKMHMGFWELSSQKRILIPNECFLYALHSEMILIIAACGI